MANFIDLEDEDLINADENDLYDENGANAINDVDEQDVDDPGIPDDPANPDDPDAPQPAATKVPPKKKVVRNPQPKLDAERLKGPRGLLILESWFKDMKFKGKGHEKEDLDAVMCRLEQWTHRLFPKFTFDDSLKRIEMLGHKKPVMNYVKRIRLDMEENYSANVHDENDDVIENEPEVDPFDSLVNSSQRNATQNNIVRDPPQITLTQEQRERMIRNRLLAEERRLARAKARAEEELAKLQMKADSNIVEEPTSNETESEQSSVATGNVPETDSSDSLINSSQRNSSQNNVVGDTPQTPLTQEQQERMIRNRLLAEERRLARAKARAEEELAKQRLEGGDSPTIIGELTRNEVEIERYDGVGDQPMDVGDMTAVSDVTHFVQQQAEFTTDESNCQEIEE